MSLKFGKQLSIRFLIMYMISAVLFLTSIDLHIHARDVATAADHHGYAVHISSLTDELIPAVAGDEIKVSPDGVLKNQSKRYQRARGVPADRIARGFLLSRLCWPSAGYCNATTLSSIPWHAVPACAPAINS